ncbi:hypothetical protein ABZ714_24350 [Streptomyces sp. NPDC006798]|uniref:hypothetical protein n=1 Tax=Streptomyces sp. NPDC006798 TaxID=3155462 RepID=UPI0033C468C2
MNGAPAECVSHAEPEGQFLAGAAEVGDDDVRFRHKTQQLIHRESGLRQILGPQEDEAELLAGGPHDVLVEDH